MINEIEITIWDREFLLPVEYDCDLDETATTEQRHALAVFTAHAEWVADAKKCVEDYCKDELAEDPENTKKDNIFSYIKPDYIFVERVSHNPRIALMCRYRYDLEHGLAIIFPLDGSIVVDRQDAIL